MGATIAIARRDFMGYILAPKAGAIFWVFLILMGFFFNSFVYSFVEMQQNAPMYGGKAPSVDQLIRALFQNIHFILLLFIPAVSMATFAEEKKAQTFRMLQTAPIKAYQIVMGKYFAMLTIMGLVLLCSAVYPIYTMTYGNPDTGIVMSSFLGVFLLMASQLAFGIWVSSMTSNQFMAFIFTMFGLFLLLILNWIAPNITGGGVAEGVVKYIASTTHFDNFLKGLITVSDLTYFACSIGIFLFFTNIVVDSQRWR